MKKDFQFEKEVKFVIDGIEQGSGTIFMINGKLDSTNLEDELYKLIRWGEKQWTKDAEEEEKDYLVNSLTKDDEEKLRGVHAESYHGTDDDMSDDYEDWLTNLSCEELKNLV